MPSARLRAPFVTTLAVLAGAAICGPSIHAQTDEDEQAARDRRYMERQRAAREAAREDPSSTSPDRRAEVVERFLARADELIRDKNFRTGGTDAYTVKTDDPRLDAGAVARLLTGFRAWFDGFWNDRVELLPYDETARMYLFWSYYKYNELFTGKARFDEFRTTGHYRGFLDTVVVHTDGTPPSELADVLVHEAAHQLIRQRLLGPDVEAPPWLDEGLAEYFAYTRQEENGRFDEGRAGGKSVWPFRHGEPETPRAAAGRKSAAVRRMKRDADWTLPTLLAADGATFYSGDVQANYGASWLLVHYLFHGEDGALAGGFADWLVRDVRGGGERRLTEALGVSEADLHDGFADWARKLRVR